MRLLARASRVVVAFSPTAIDTAADSAIMVRVRRMVRRSLIIAVLSMLFATALAAPDALAEPDPPATFQAETDQPVDHRTRGMSASARLFGADSEELLVGHADVLRLYWAFFNRDPDSDGANYWIAQFDEGATLDDIAFSFAGSEEFTNTYGDTVDRQFVKIVYRNVLGRSPDTEGFNYWVGLLAEPAVSRVDVVRWISASSEFIGAHPYRRPSVAEALVGSPEMAVAVDVLESLAAQRPTAGLPADRSAELMAAVDRVQKRFGRFSSVTPLEDCERSDRTATCAVAMTEVDLGQDLLVSVVGGQVVAIDEAQDRRMWADDAVRTAVTGRSVFGSRTLPSADRQWIEAGTRRISSAIGTVGRVRVSAGECNLSSIPGKTPDAEAIDRVGCAYLASGPTYQVELEAVSHDGVFAGLHVVVPRRYTETGFGPYATVGSGSSQVTLHHPANRVERIGFHESGHDGSQQQNALPTDAVVMTMETRNRGNQSRSAADIAVHPTDIIRAPVTGTVLRAGTYTLYCRHTDHFLVIEPDSRPGYQVKVLHFEGLSVAKGDRVVAGKTQVGTHVRKLPFESQIDKSTADPSNGHIHIEVVDPSIPDRPSGGGC